MITIYEFKVIENYIQCHAFSDVLGEENDSTLIGMPSDNGFENLPILEEIVFIPRLRSRIIVSIESLIKGKGNIPCSITILTDASFLMSVQRFNVIDQRVKKEDDINEPPISQPISPPQVRVEVIFFWDGKQIDFDALINALAENTAVMIK